MITATMLIAGFIALIVLFILILFGMVGELLSDLEAKMVAKIEINKTENEIALIQFKVELLRELVSKKDFEYAMKRYQEAVSK